MITVRDVPATEFNNKLKEELKKFEEIKPPEWSRFAKSGVSRERPPIQHDFWYIRAASILRRVYLNEPIGIQRLRTFYGGRKRRGHKPAKFRKASGNIVRKVLLQLEAAGLLVKDKKGRKITPKGRKLLDKIAYEVGKE